MSSVIRVGILYIVELILLILPSKMVFVESVAVSDWVSLMTSKCNQLCEETFLPWDFSEMFEISQRDKYISCCKWNEPLSKWSELNIFKPVTKGKFRIIN